MPGDGPQSAMLSPSSSLRIAFSVGKIFIFAAIIAGISYGITLPIERSLIEKYWRMDHMDNEAVYQAQQDIDEARYEEAQRLANLLTMSPNSSEIQEFLIDYIYTTYGATFKVPGTLKEEQWTASLWAGITDTLLKRDPLPKVGNRGWVAPLKILLAFVGTVISTILIGSMVAAIWTTFTAVSTLICLHKKSLLGPLLVIFMSFLYAFGMLFLVATLPKYDTLIVGLTDGIYKMIGFYQQRATYEEKAALMEFVTRLLLLSAQGVFVFSLCDFYMAARVNPNGVNMASDLRFFNSYQKSRLEKMKKDQ